MHILKLSQVYQEFHIFGFVPNFLLTFLFNTFSSLFNSCVYQCYVFLVCFVSVVIENFIFSLFYSTGLGMNVILRILVSNLFPLSQHRFYRICYKLSSYFFFLFKVIFLTTRNQSQCYSCLLNWKRLNPNMVKRFFIFWKVGNISVTYDTQL